MKGELYVLDGATGTELNRRGVDTGLPLWSANALTSDTGLNALRQIHLDYLSAGADILTTNTFRTHRRVLDGTGHDARELTRRAVATAREAVAEFGRPARVAGSVAPLEDCYRPDLVPPDDECSAEHSERIHHLVEAGVDLLLIETMTSVREAVIAAKMATITGRPTWVSFVCDREGRILSGESVKVAAEILMPLGVKALGVNCGPAHKLAKPLAELRTFCGPDFPLIAYGNIGYADEKEGWVNTDAVDPESYLKYAQTWPAQIVGGCCGTTPDHIRKLKAHRVHFEAMAEFRHPTRSDL
ncbi:MAG: homocysteine S-methyltransferase family protein [Verrucomicrobiales bacterium]|nr:homocysteine S-methyltransferase family protein [Verrucomicrobiales bacterium]